MTPATLTTPNTLYLACYGDEQIAYTGTLRRMDGSIEEDVLSGHGELWAAMAQALAEAAVVNTRHIIVLSNSPALLRWHVAPAPESFVRIWEQKGKGKGNGQYEQYPVGGDPLQWAVMRGLLGYWCRGGSYQVLAVDGSRLKRAQELFNDYILAVVAGNTPKPSGVSITIS